MDQLFRDYAETNGEIAAESLRHYALLQNFDFISKFKAPLLKTIRVIEPFNRLAFVNYSRDTSFFALSIENMITAYESRVLHKYCPSVFKIILANLENSHENVRVLLLQLFKLILKCFVHNEVSMVGTKSEIENHAVEMVTKILKLPWTNRNKYVMLAHIVSIKPELLIYHPDFNLHVFVKGLFIGCTLHHLHSPSQALVKVIHNKEPFCRVLIELVAEALWKGKDDLIAENLAKYWFSVFEPQFVEKLHFEISFDGQLRNIPTISNKFHRLLILRNAFKKKFKDDELDERVKEFAFVVDDLPIKIEIFHILADNIYLEPQVENILTFLAFLRFNMCIKGTKHFFKLQHLFV